MIEATKKLAARLARLQDPALNEAAGHLQRLLRVKKQCKCKGTGKVRVTYAPAVVVINAAQLNEVAWRLTNGSALCREFIKSVKRKTKQDRYVDFLSAFRELKINARKAVVKKSNPTLVQEQSIYYSSLQEYRKVMRFLNGLYGSGKKMLGDPNPASLNAVALKELREIKESTDDIRVKQTVGCQTNRKNLELSKLTIFDLFKGVCDDNGNIKQEYKKFSDQSEKITL